MSARTCAYQGVRNVSFSKDFAYVLNELIHFIPMFHLSPSVPLDNSENQKFSRSMEIEHFHETGEMQI